MRRTPHPIRSTSPALLLLLVLVPMLACSGTRSGGEPPDLARFEAGELQFPGTGWSEVERPARWGWSEDRLAEAEAYVETLDTSSVMVVHRGVLIESWGEVTKREAGQSIRKALLGALIGQEVEADRLSLDATLEELGIDDRSNPLELAEKEARVRDLLRSTSGIYLSSIYESPVWKRFKPERGSHAPGEQWFYNNWGFNALAPIYEQASGVPFHRGFRERVAEPIGLEDYREKDVDYLTRSHLAERIMGNDSEHPAYHVMISARDLARFGLLYLAGGRWGDVQVVPAAWVERTTSDSVATNPRFDGDRYGYLWWISPAESVLGETLGAGAYKATGGRGHKLLVVPDLDLVVVHRIPTGGVGFFSQLRRRVLGAPGVNDQQFSELMRLIVAAHPDR